MHAEGWNVNSQVISEGIIVIIFGIVIVTPIGDLLLWSPYGGEGSIKVLTSVGCIAVGLVIVLWGVIARPKKKYPIKVCGNCFYFQKPECAREEKLPNTMPCESFLQKEDV